MIEPPRSNAEGVRIETPRGWGKISIADLKMVSFDAFCVVFKV